MKIVFTSDLHYPITHKWQLKELVENIAAENPNAVILGGDIAENLKDSQETNSFTFPHFRLCLELFTKRLTCPVLVILGNHDLWTDSPSNNSLMIWNNIGDVVKSCGAVYLEDNPQIIIDKPTNVMIIGSYLHYDYSAAEKTGVASGYDKDYWRINKHRVNNDGHYLKGLPDDIEFAGALARSLKTQLVDAEQDATIQNIIVATHVPCMEQQMTRRPADVGWAMGTPYFGNLSCQDFISSCDKVRWVIAGHSHCHEDHTVTVGGDRSIRVMTLGADYRRPIYQVMEI